jgi:hypothetical protein
MKRIPAGILLATLFFTVPLVPRTLAEESASQLADQDLGPDSDNQDESAEALAQKDGVADGASQDTDQSAQSLANQNGLADPSQDPEESASSLAKQQGLNAASPDESASKLAEQAGLEKKSKKVGSPAQSVFSGEGIDGSVYAIAAMADGSAIVGGRFTTVNGQPRANLARIKADGTLDSGFLAASTDGVNGAVYALAVDGSGNLLVGGYFTSAQGLPLQNFVRYLANGTIDPKFAEGQSPNGSVYAIAVQPDGKILIGGKFSQVGSTPRQNLARFNADSTLDAPVTAANSGTGTIRSLAVLANGAILAGGTFEIPGQPARNILTAP